MNKITEFKKELKALLSKYNAGIWIELEGDTHGIDTCALVIDVDNKPAIRAENGTLEPNDIKD